MAAPLEPTTDKSSTSSGAISTSATTENTSTAQSSNPEPEPEPELDFQGDVLVSNDIPTQADLDKCADLLVLDAQGTSRPFKTLYAGEGVAPRQLIIFVRHFFCGNCQEYLRTLSSSITPEALLTLPTPTFITVIGCGRPELIDMYAATTGCPFPIYADPTRKLYDYLGMGRTLDFGKKKPDYIQSNLFATTVQSIAQILKTGRDGLKGGDFKQVGGEFIFEEGKVVWCHRMRNTRDHAQVPELRRLIGLDDAKPPIRKRWSHGIKEIKKRNTSWGKSKEPKEGRRSGSRTRLGGEKVEEMRADEEKAVENGKRGNILPSSNDTVTT
ncbi:hypothetical protein AOQ84DRAFT_296320 [Glonium stellatum]|uniref:Uncharacterized protein n=1 Tax=Glonium stellatum TaxID=574774 RepID=A0A8E2EY27_9PEZI|nr:hypothetical protein AOQ84DRAFT_296320 [Glonium stellatum]